MLVRVSAWTPTQIREPRQALVTFFLIFGIGINSWLARIPDIKIGMDLSTAQLGWILLAGSAANLAAIGPLGRVLAHRGSAIAIRNGTLAFAASLVLLGLVGHPLLLIPVLMLYGVAASAIDMGMNAHTVTWQEHTGRVIMGSLHATWSIGAFIGIGLGGIASQVGVPVWLHLSGVAVLLVGMTLLVRRWLMPDAIDVHPQAAEHSMRTWNWPAWVYVLGGIGFIAALAEGSAGDWSAIHLREELGASPVVGASAMSAFTASMVVARFAGDRILARFSRVRVLQVSGLLTGLGLGGGLMIGTIPSVIIGWACAGAGLAVMIPVAVSSAVDITDRPRAHALAVITGLMYLGFIIGPPLIGVVAESIGLGRALLIPAALGLCVAVAATWSRPRSSVVPSAG